MCLAIPGQVIEFVDEANRLAKVDVAGVRRTVNVGLLDADDDGGAQPGDWVLIHVGFALSKVDEEEAHATLELLRGMGSEFEQELEELKASVIDERGAAGLHRRLDGCITCGDDAGRVRVVERRRRERPGRVRRRARRERRRSTSSSWRPSPPGEQLLVHAGTSRIAAGRRQARR